MLNVSIRSCATIVLALALGSHAFALGDVLDPQERARLARYEWPGPLDDGLRRAGAVLRSARVAGRDPESLARRLAEPGAAAIGPLLDVLAHARVPKGVDSDLPQALSEPQRALVLAAIARLQNPAVRTELDRRLSETTASEGTRIAALHVIGVIGGPGDIVRLASIAPRRADGQLDDAARSALRGAFSAILRREPSALRVAEQVLRKRDATVGKELLFALAELRDARVVRLCFDVARNDPKLSQQALALVRQSGRSGEPELDRQFSTWLVSQIDPQRPEWTRAVLLAIGALDEGDCVETLIGLIDDTNLGVRESALSALRSIGGSTLGADGDAWMAWYGREVAWMTSERPRWVENLKDESPSKVVDALQAYSDRRLFQSQLARDVLPLLERDEPGLQELACETLARLGSRVAVPALAAELSGHDPAVEGAARRALTKLLGREVPHDFAALQAMIPAN